MGMVAPMMKRSFGWTADYARRRATRNVLRTLVGVAVALGVAGAGALEAQQALPRPSREELTAFARVHMAMNAARDELHAEIGRTHEEQARARAREAFEARVVEIYAEHDTTKEEYDRLVLLMSVDEEIRAQVDEILAELEETGSAENPG